MAVLSVLLFVAFGACVSAEKVFSLDESGKSTLEYYSFDALSQGDMCKEKCARTYCNDPSFAFRVPDCAAKHMVADPFLCGGPACEEVSCDNCGSVSKCERLCGEFKTANGLGDGDFPDCNYECNYPSRAAAKNYVCFNPCVPSSFDAPECPNLMDCSGALCGSHRHEKCAAKTQIVDPAGCYRGGNTCRKIGCKRCGDNTWCKTLCERHNTRYGDSIDCRDACNDVDGYKCFKSCSISEDGTVVDHDDDMSDEEYELLWTQSQNEAALAVEGELESSWAQQNVNAIVFAVSTAVLLLVAVYLYMRCSAANDKYTSIPNKTPIVTYS